MNIDQVIETCRSIAEQHYPDDAAKRNEYLVGLLETKLREVAHRNSGPYPQAGAPFLWHENWKPA